MTENNNTFHAGICMAGAVSAGAYTAGVMDYLLETLENWDKAKQLQAQGKLTGVPQHNFIIEVLSGASAGGMTAAITAAAIQNHFPHMEGGETANELNGKQNPIYNAWVNLLEEDGKKDMMDVLLSTNDIDGDGKNNPHNEVRSGFNSDFIACVAKNVFDNTVKDKNCLRPYIAPDADIFTTITNLRGFTYKITFKTSQGIREHRMKMHRDIACFRLNEHGEYDNDGRIPLHFNTVVGFNKEVLIDAAMATGAFPLGLEPRLLNRNNEYIQQNKYLNLHIDQSENYEVKHDLLSDTDYQCLNVDGGVINNEPFDITQKFLDDRRRTRLAKSGDPDAVNYQIKTEAKDFDSTVIMVDPFPNDENNTTTGYTPLRAWKSIVPQILGAMRGQLMLKEDQVQKAYSPDDYTRFLISPVRTLKGEKQKFTIACGSLEGFGGFFSKKFRVHDFYLGRRNCQRFIQHYFNVPVNAENDIIEFGYKNIKEQYAYIDYGTKYLPIIPDFRVVETNGTYSLQKPPEEKEPTYPTISLKYILGLEDKIKTRLSAILDNIGKGESPVDNGYVNPVLQRIRKQSWLKKLTGTLIKQPLTKAYINLGKTFSKAPLAEKCVDVVIDDMYKRGLLNEDC
jgi:predicted acylesterase/phospholipase RssA